MAISNLLCAAWRRGADSRTQLQGRHFLAQSLLCSLSRRAAAGMGACLTKSRGGNERVARLDGGRSIVVHGRPFSRELPKYECR
jgi:hypothetical protein